MKLAGDGWWKVETGKHLQPSYSAGIDWGLRATFRGLHQGTKVPEITLRETGETNYNAFLQGDGTAIMIQRFDANAVTRYQTIAKRELAVPIPPGTPYTLEFIVLGKRLRLRLGDELLEVAAPAAPTKGRGAIYGAGYDQLRDIEVLNLDGLSEAEALKFVESKR